MSETTEKTKRAVNRTPQQMVLCRVQRNDDGAITGFVPVVQPPLEGDGPHRRADYERAVKKALEEATNENLLAAYNKTELVVVSFPPPFTFNVKVEEEVIRKTVVSKQ